MRIIEIIIIIVVVVLISLSIVSGLISAIFHVASFENCSVVFVAADSDD
jgi:uncharacterized membrane protein required for colicin V production